MVIVAGVVGEGHDVLGSGRPQLAGVGAERCHEQGGGTPAIAIDIVDDEVGDRALHHSSVVGAARKMRELIFRFSAAHQPNSTLWVMPVNDEAQQEALALEGSRAGPSDGLTGFI